MKLNHFILPALILCALSAGQSQEKTPANPAAESADSVATEMKLEKIERLEVENLVLLIGRDNTRMKEIVEEFNALRAENAERNRKLRVRVREIISARGLDPDEHSIDLRTYLIEEKEPVEPVAVVAQDQGGAGDRPSIPTSPSNPTPMATSGRDQESVKPGTEGEP